jgi:predicted amidohydrolase YtcJ
VTTTLFARGSIVTGTEEHAEWVIVQDDLIAAVGVGGAPSADRIVDLEGAVLVPAFRDGHVHLQVTGLFESAMDFRGQHDGSQILAGFSERADQGEDILFGGNFEEPVDPPITRLDLDSATGGHRALLARADLHSCVVSSALLDELDLSTAPGVDRDEAGAPTGYLREQAAAAAWKAFDEGLSAQAQRQALRAGVFAAYRKGVAEAHEMFVVEWRGWGSAESFLENVGEYALNVPVYLGTSDIDRVREMGFERIGGDYFLDGSFGTHTAWMQEPYEAPPPGGSSERGLAYRSDDELSDFFLEAQNAGLQVGVHAIGDAAIEQAIAAWERVADKFGVEEVRRRHHRIEHFECASDDHIARAARLGLAASVQPAFDRLWGGGEGLYATRIGRGRAALMNRFGSMIAADMVVGGGSDSTVTPLDPFLQMSALRDHHVPRQSLDPPTAMLVMTSGVAGLAADEGTRGCIAPGQWAEFALLDRNPLDVDPTNLLHTEVLGTWVGGRRVWPRSKAEAQ